jgi:hypothetical protein
MNKEALYNSFRIAIYKLSLLPHPLNQVFKLTLTSRNIYFSMSY